MAKTTGDRIDLHDRQPFTFPADTPFYIRHGYHNLNPKTSSYRRLDFKLFIDGVQQVHGSKKRGKTIFATGVEDYWLFWIFNFRQGLPAGSYVFRREYWIPCHVAAEDWETVNNCADPNEIILGFSDDRTGTFTGTFIRSKKETEYKIQID
jgi:hypothetical protein